MKLLYINRTVEGCQVMYDQGVVCYKTTPIGFINQICMDNTSTYIGRKDAIRKKFGIKKLTPIWVNDETLLFPIESPRSFDNIWINYHEVIAYRKGFVVFRGGIRLLCENLIINSQLKKCFEIAFS